MLKPDKGNEQFYTGADEPIDAMHSGAISGEIVLVELKAQVSKYNREGLGGPKDTMLFIDDIQLHESNFRYREL